MGRTIMAVFTNPTSPDVEDEYNTWYDEVHLKELLAVPGVVSANRYRLRDGANAASSEHRYLAVYELDGPQETVLAALGSGSAPSPAVDAAGARILFWEPVPGGSA